MRKIFTKKQNKRLLIIGLSTLLVILILGTLFLVLAHESNRYKACEEYTLDNENYIKGIDWFRGYYLNAPSSFCTSQVKNDIHSSVNKGPYKESLSCQIQGVENKTYVTSSIERCAFGCFEGECMKRCEAPNSNNLFVKGIAYGVSGNSDTSLQYDYCTNSDNTEHHLLSKFVAKQTCAPDNFLTTNISECSNICFDGACQKENFNYCGDSDYNDKGKINGTITVYNTNSKKTESFSDSCLDSKTVTEYFCGADKKQHKLILTCRNQCSDGACL